METNKMKHQKRLKKDELLCLTCNEIFKSKNLKTHSSSKSHLDNVALKHKTKVNALKFTSKASIKKSLKKPTLHTGIIQRVDDFKPSVKIKTATEVGKFAAAVEKFKKDKAEKSIGSFKVLKEKIYITPNICLIRVSHNTGMIDCNELFPLLDSKIQKFAVVCVKQLLKHKENYGDLQYLESDKFAVRYAVKTYPNTPKPFWVLALKVLFGENISTLNLKRLKSASKILNLSKHKGVKKMIAQYKKSVDNQYPYLNKKEEDFDFEGDILVDDGDFKIQDATEEKISYAPMKIRKILIGRNAK